MINTVALTGRLTYSPELKVTPSGVSVIRFTIACDRNYQAKGEDRKADFIDCVAWRSTSEFVSRYFHKGDMIGVEGSIQTENYTDKDGNKRKSVTVVADNVSFCGGKSESKPNLNIQAPTEYASADDSDFEEIEDMDDLPFD